MENNEDLKVLAQLQADQDLIESFMEEVDKIPMEDKIIAAFEEENRAVDLTPWDIDGIVQEALGKIQDVIEPDSTDLVYDVVYEAITEAVHRRE